MLVIPHRPRSYTKIIEIEIEGICSVSGRWEDVTERLYALMGSMTDGNEQLCSRQEEEHFNKWMEAVDAFCIEKIGLSVHDLDDVHG